MDSPPPAAAGGNKVPPSSSSKTAELDAPLHAIGFEIDDLSPNKVTGHLLVTPKCCQVIITLISKF